MASTKLFSRLHIHKLVNALVQRTWAKTCTTSCPSHVDLRHALANRRLNRSAEKLRKQPQHLQPFQLLLLQLCPPDSSCGNRQAGRLTNKDTRHPRKPRRGSKMR